MKKIFLLLMPLTVFAADNTGLGTTVLPGGPWQNSCNTSKSALVNGRLTAFCRTNNFLGGAIVSLDYANSCKNDALVDYKNGELLCLNDSDNADATGLQTKLPEGNWVNFCNKQTATFINGQLKTSCSPKNGALGTTLAVLDYSTNCTAGAAVDYKNGELMCVADQSNIPTKKDLPGGNWITSCNTHEVEVNGTMLITKCQNDGGNYVSSAVDLAKCDKNTTLSNNNGQLSCNKLAVTDNLPGGDWRDYCDVKSAELSRTKTFRAKCKVWSGSYFSTFLFYDNCKSGANINYDTDKEKLYCAN